MPAISINPCLWFDDQAEDAARFYTSIFPGARIGRIQRYGSEGREIHGRPPGSVLTVEFKANFVAPASGEVLAARARVRRSGRTLTVCEADAFARQGPRDVLVATMLATIMTLGGA